MFALYWDESDPNEPGTEKIRRALYSTYEDALLQAEHDLECLRCRVDKDGLYKVSNKATGKEPLNPKEKCRDCNGTTICPSRNILYIENIDDNLLAEFHAESRMQGKVGNTPAFVHGKRVWTRE